HSFPTRRSSDLFFEALGKREIAEHGPEHHGEGKRHAVGFGRRGNRKRRNRRTSSRRGQSCASTSSHEFATTHFRLPEFHCERFSRRKRRARRQPRQKESDPHFQC